MPGQKREARRRPRGKPVSGRIRRSPTRSRRVRRAIIAVPTLVGILALSTLFPPVHGWVQGLLTRPPRSSAPAPAAPSTAPSANTTPKVSSAPSSPAARPPMGCGATGGSVDGWIDRAAGGGPTWRLTDDGLGAPSSWTKVRAPAGGYRKVDCQGVGTAYRAKLEGTFDIDPQTRNHRSEGSLSGVSLFEGDRSTLSWSTLFPEGFEPPAKWLVWTQFHQRTGDPGFPPDLYHSPPLELSLHGETLQLRVRGGYYDNFLHDYDGGVLWEGALERGIWKNYELTVDWSSDSKKGRVIFGIDGKTVADARAATLYPEKKARDRQVFLAQGIYRDPATSWREEIYHAQTQLTVHRAGSPPASNSEGARRAYALEA